MKKKLLSVCLAAAMAVTMTPWTALQGAVYAADDPAVEVTEQDTEDEAAAQLEACKQRVSQAETDLQEKTTAYETAKAESEAADQAYRDKKAVSDQADQALADAQQAAETAAAELTTAQTNKEAAEAAVSDAERDLAEAQEAQQTADAAVPAAQRAVATANSQWEAAKQAAANELDAAQKAYDEAGYNFINSKVNAMGSKYYTIDEIIANEMNSNYGVTAWNGTSLKMKEIVGHKYFKEIVKQACSYNNLKQGIEFVKHTNSLRTNPRHNLSALKTNYQLTANGVVSAAVCAYARAHNLLNSSDSKYWELDGLYYGGVSRFENLAYSSYSIERGYDPFDSWYYKERIVQLGNDQGGITQDIINQVTQEAIDDGRNNFSPTNLGSTTGHYLAIIHPGATAMGAAYTQVPANLIEYGCTYPVISSLEFSYTDTNNISVSQYESALESYFAEYITNLDAAQNAVEALETAPSYVTQAQQALQDAQDAATQAAQDVTNAQTAVTNAEQVLANAQQTLTQKQTENNEAQSALTAAQAAAQTANQETAAAKQIMENKRTALDEAESAWKGAKTALQAAQEDEDSAQAIYDAFFKLENASAEAIEDQTYTGSGVEPEVVIWNKGHTKKLTSGDYSLTYDKNVNVGTATVTAEGKDKYSGSLEQTFAIVQADIAKAEAAEIAEQSYTGKGVRPQPELTFNGKELTKGTDYEITGYENNIEVGTDALVSIEGKGNFKGTTSLKFAIAPAKIAAAQVGQIEDQTYTGKALMPKPAVTFNEEELSEGTDYEITGYDNNINAGKATITIKGKGRFTDTAQSNFTILPAGMDKVQIGQIEGQTYTGKELTPQPVITFNDEVLTAGTDYEITGYENNTNVGEATISIKGKGNFKDSASASFMITKADIAKADIAPMDPEKSTGQALTPQPKLTFNGAALKAGTDYDISYENNVEIGTATINIEGKGNFKGTTSCSFEIVENDSGYSQLSEAEKKTVDDIMSKLQMDAEEAIELYNFAQEAGIPMDTLLITDAAILKGNTDSDLKGAHFSPLTAKAAKTTKTSVKLKWTKNAKADGYKIYGNLCGKAKKVKLLKTIKGNGATSFTQKKLKKGKYYKYVVVAYKNIGGKQITIAASPTIHAATIGGKAGNHKKVTTKAKKSKVTVTVGKTFKLGAKAVPLKAKNKVKKHRAVSYDSANKAIATVSAKGVIKGVKKGTCYVYAYAQNGVFAKIKVTVK